jgi:hypothetical protein
LGRLAMSRTAEDTNRRQLFARPPGTAAGSGMPRPMAIAPLGHASMPAGY